MLARFKRYYHNRKKQAKFRRELEAFMRSRENTKSRFDQKEEDVFPQLDDATATTGFDRHYVYHVAWAVRMVKKINPAFHTDISSSLHFCTTLSAFIPVKFYDYRPAVLTLDNLTSEAADLTKLHFADNSIESLSCLHTIEHIGLGRYGDPIDYDGDLKAIAELKRVVKPGGSLLFVTPVGKAKIMFNAHRIYSYNQVIKYFEGFDLKEFSLVPDSEKDGGLIQNASPEISDQQNYGCGCFWFVKKIS
jgi:SAM-dependent methyltransferase